MGWLYAFVNPEQKAEVETNNHIIRNQISTIKFINKNELIGDLSMDVRNSKIEPTIEHGGTCLTYFMYPKESIRSETMGSYLEYISEFELKPGAHLEPHKHNSHEYYFMLEGEAVVQVEDEQRTLKPGDLVLIPPNAAHSIWPAREGESFRGFAFAVSYMPADSTGHVVCELPPVRK